MMNPCPRVILKGGRILCGLAMSLVVMGANAANAADEPSVSPAKELVSKAIAAAGGNDKLLTLFRMEERFNSGKERVSPGTSRISVVEPPSFWWIGKKERGAEPAKITTWAWTLGIFNDPKSQIELIPDITDNDEELAGVRVTGSADPAIDLFFRKTTCELVRVDWRNDIYRFSEWKEYDGTRYPAKCTMYRRKSGEPWFFHEIVSIERLKELPEGLTRE